MFKTIRSKLVVLLVVLMAGFMILGYQIIKSNNDGKMAATRLSMLGDVEASLSSSMMELRGFQLLGKNERLLGLELHYKKTIASLDSLSLILMSKHNQEMMEKLKTDTKSWYTLNAPRIEILKKYGAKVNDSLFIEEHQEEYANLVRLTKETDVLFVTILKDGNTLKESVRKANFER